jgi:hypothetical protein
MNTTYDGLLHTGHSVYRPLMSVGPRPFFVSRRLGQLANDSVLRQQWLDSLLLTSMLPIWHSPISSNRSLPSICVALIIEPYLIVHVLTDFRSRPTLAGDEIYRPTCRVGSFDKQFCNRSFLMIVYMKTWMEKAKKKGKMTTWWLGALLCYIMLVIWA